MSDAPVPSVLALLVCEKIITEAVTNNKTLISVFDRIETPQFPAVYGPFWIYARMADAEGDYILGVELNHLETEKQIGKSTGIKLNIASRLAAHEVGIHMPIVKFDWPGTYEILIYANEVWVGRTTVTVVQR